MYPFVNIHTHNHIDNKDFIQITNISLENFTNIDDLPRFYSIGIHPWESRQATDNSQQTLSKLTQRLRDSEGQGLIAIGECGIDRACDSDIEIQKSIFMKQIELSEQYQKPLIIHCVRAYPDIISIKKAAKAKQPWIIHGFQGNEQTATQLLNHGIFLSLGDILFKNEDRAKRLLKIIPSEKSFLETDISERKIIDVYEKASLLSERNIDELREDIFNNFVKIFGKI